MQSSLFENLLLKKFSRVIVVYCSIIKVLFTVLFKRQLLYFIKSFSLCQELFNFFQSFYLLRSFSRVSLDIISFVLLNVNTFFKVFSFSSKLILYHSRYHLIILTYKNYWLSSIFPDDIKRRKRDLNPRAGHPTYTLSRGTSSAS